MRMNPSSATWVETMKTRPFWTLATIRRPSRSPYIRVANESSPRTRSEASRATAVPLPIATATSACWSAGASLTPSPVTATVRPTLRATSTRRSLSSGIARATTVNRPSSPARRSSSQAARSAPTTTRTDGIPAARAIAAAVVGWSPVTTIVWIPAAVAMRIASDTPGRRLSAKATIASGSQRRAAARACQQQQPAASRGLAFDEPGPGADIDVRTERQGQDRLGCADDQTILGAAFAVDRPASSSRAGRPWGRRRTAGSADPVAGHRRARRRPRAGPS